MADIDLKAATPDTSLPETGFLIGADSQSAADPSIYPVDNVRQTMLRSSAGIKLGADDAASPTAQTVTVQNVVAGTSNTAGADLTVKGSQGTGTGAGGAIIFQTAAAGSSGTSQNALADALKINSNGSIVFGGTTLNPNNGQISWLQTVAITIQTANGLTLRHGNGDPVMLRPASSGVPWLQFADTTNTAQTNLLGEAAAVLAQRNGTTAQAFRVYKTYANGGTDYERLAITGTAITVETGGTGADDIDLTLTPAGSGTLKFGNWTSKLYAAVNGYVTIKDAAGNTRKLATIA